MRFADYLVPLALIVLGTPLAAVGAVHRAPEPLAGGVLFLAIGIGTALITFFDRRRLTPIPVRSRSPRQQDR